MAICITFGTHGEYGVNTSTLGGDLPTPGVSVRVRIHTDAIQDAWELMIGLLFRVYLHAAGL